jgi:membrane protein YdbS with pleckstrin-like domain
LSHLDPLATVAAGSDGKEGAGVAFPERLLSEDEELIYDLRPHWWTLVVPVVITVLVTVAVGVAWALTPAGSLQAPARLVTGVAGLLLLAVLVAGRVLRWLTTHFVLTTERLIFRSGVVAKFGREIPLERINDVTFSQSLFERLIGIGDLVIESAGEQGQSTFSDIRDPEAVQLQIYRQMDANGRRRGGFAPVAPHRPPGVLSDLERLADLRDRGALTEEEFQTKKRELLDRL